MIKIKCFIIGQGSLFKQCVEFLQTHQGVEILGIISPDNKIRDWALTQEFEYADTLERMLPTMHGYKFDYLFSIVNHQIIPESILKLPRKCAINYHDSLLPGYAGIHATSWALLNSEEMHGVTWHVISKGIDTGDILKQAQISIVENETTISLNVKCYEAALLTFESLILDVLSNSILEAPQDLSKRTYFGLYQKPLANAILDFNSPAESIKNTHDATLFGEQYVNAFTRSKILIGERIFIPQEIEICCECSYQPPGKIIELSRNYIRVATKTNDIVIKGIVDLYNHPQDFAQLKRSKIINNEKLLPILNVEMQQKIKDEAEVTSRHEKFWVNCLENLTVAQTPLPITSKISEHYSLVQTQTLANDAVSSRSELETLCSILIYLFRINNYQVVSLTYSNDKIIESNRCLNKSLPMTTCFTPDDNFNNVMRNVTALLESYESKPGFLNDICIRYPTLRNKTVYSQLGLYFGDIHKLEGNNIGSPYILVFNNNKMSIYTKYIALTPIQIERVNYIVKGCEHVIEENRITQTSPIKNMQVITEQERKLLLEIWNNHSVEPPLTSSLISLFYKNVDAYPEHVAVKYGNASLTYMELDQQSNQLAAYLRGKHHVISQSYVPIYFNVGLNMLLTILAIVKLGAIYVPIKKDMPATRIQTILQDCSAEFLVSDTQSVYNIDTQDIKYVDLSVAKKEISVESADRVLSEISNEDLLYVIYTSGTTGVPKGVQIQHNHLQNLLCSANKYFDFKIGDKWSIFHSYAFDFSVWEMWGALSNGGIAVLISEDTIHSPMEFVKLTLREGLTILNLTPQAFKLFSEYVIEHRLRDLLALRYVIFGGEALDNKALNKWFAYMSEDKPKMINMYGITETTIHTTFCTITKNLANKHRHIPIGRPLPHLSVYILDKYKNFMPIGIQGEAYICGDSIAKGYLQRDDLTEDKFPFIDIDGQSIRAYRSGDSLKWSESGSLEYCGRIDNQVKIRGYRIELSSIENAMLQHDDIMQCVVMSKKIKDNYGLFAYVVQNVSSQLSVEEIKAFLSNLLPNYMVPSRIILMEAMPLTSNWKIDKKLLPEPRMIGRNNLTTKYEAPSTLTEERLCGIWKNILNIDDIGVVDDFFLLGGDSLSVTRVVLDIREKFNLDMALNSFFAKPTVKQLAVIIDGYQNKNVNLYEDEDVLIANDIKLLDNLSMNLEDDDMANDYLLTGANGFLGIHLLHKLLEHTTVNIYCLIRANSKMNARNRLARAAKQYMNNFGWLDNNRIKILVGDIAFDQLGLSHPEYNELSANVGVILHNAAYVHHIYNYDVLRDVNVKGTVNIVKCATNIKRKRIIYVSTLSTLCEKNQFGEYTEDYPRSEISHSDLSGGYAKSKWVSEFLMKKATEQGVTTTIYRLGWVLGRSDNGCMAYRNNHFISLLKSSVQLGVAPDWQRQFNIFPVDILSDFMIKSVLKSSEVENKVFNIVNPNGILWTQLIGHLNTLGFNVNIIAEQTWLKEYVKNLTNDNALYPLLPLYISKNKRGTQNDIENIRTESTTSLFKTLNCQYPKITYDIVDRYIKFLTSMKYLAQPTLERKQKIKAA